MSADNYIIIRKENKDWVPIRLADHFDQEKNMTRKRARNPKGQYEGDDPSTPDIDEAWELTEPKYMYIADNVVKRIDEWLKER